MSRICELCSKTDKKATSRSHSNIATLRKQKVNLQNKFHLGRAMRICARCIRTMNKKAEKMTLAV